MESSAGAPVIAQLGDDALLFTFGDSISWEVGTRVRSVADRIRAIRIEAVTDVVPAYTTIGVYFDNTRTTAANIIASVGDVLGQVGLPAPDEYSSLIEIPVRYDGPDLTDVAVRTGLTVAEVIERHSSRNYRAYVSGFVPGFTYLGDLDESLVLARRSVPRVRVPAGSVAIAGAQTAVYPLDTPGGWHLIGTTAVVMFDAARESPALLRPGDTVRFVRID